MKRLFDEVSYLCSKRMTSTYSTSFSMAVKMLATGIRPAIYAIYGFVRLADEIVDTFHDYDKKSLFEELNHDLENALTHQISLNPILNAFQDTVHRYNIGYDLIQSFLGSMHADLHKQNYDTTAEYEQYIYGSADVVGLMCLKVFVNGDQAMYNRLKYPAQKLGSAFQKVNFLRDYKNDAEILKRSYFPHLVGRQLDSVTKAKIIDEIEKDFEDAFNGIRQLPLDAKFGVYTAYLYYRKLLQKIKKAHVEDIHAKRIRISNTAKFGLLARSFVSFKLNLL
jgi:phytoene/squalene synthetase